MLTLRSLRWILPIALAVSPSLPAAAQEPSASPTARVEGEPAAKPPKRRSPWILLPLFSSNPKLGTSFGGLAGYATKFDPESQVSLFGLAAQYTSTDSAVMAGLSRISLKADRHRISAYVAAGRVRNDYDDYLGTGVPLRSEDNVRALLARYLHRWKGDWFAGGQFVVTNYHIVGQTALDDDILNFLGLTGFESGGVGLVLYHDSRDVQDKPTRGWLLNVNDVAYREWISGESNFDVYRLDYRHFWPRGNGHVLALRQSNQWTVDAPPAAWAPVLLRGYTMGEYLGEHMSSLELEGRFKIANRWTATAFGGAAVLYGDGSSSGEIHPCLGGGVQYVLKPVQGIVANLEYAQGEEGNSGVIFKMGYGW